MIQFNWSRRWGEVEPHLKDKEVRFWTTFGCRLLDKDWTEEDGPHWVGRGSINGQRVYKGKLSWYQPWGRCHWIAPFSWAIGKKLYPQLNWGFYTSDRHTIAVGFDGLAPEICMDILLFKTNDASDSLCLVGHPRQKVMNPFELFAGGRDVSPMVQAVSQPDFDFDLERLSFNAH